MLTDIANSESGQGHKIELSEIVQQMTDEWTVVKMLQNADEITSSPAIFVAYETPNI